MSLPPFAGRLLIGAIAIQCSVLIAPPVWSQTTEWVGAVGDWHTASNWSNGVPVAGTDAIVPFSATPTVTLAGAICRNLSTGTGSGGSTLRIQSGSLAVAQMLHVATAHNVAAQQSGGAVNANELVLGNPNATGAYTLTGGTLTAATVRVGTLDPTSGGIFSLSGASPQCAIGDSLVLGPDGSFVCGAGTLTVGSGGSGGTRVDGAFTLTNAPSVTMSGFTMGPNGTLSVALLPTGIGTITVTGTAVLSGTLLVTDVAAPNGTYEILSAGSLEGGFDSSFLPPSVSLRVEGGTVSLIKGTVPVEPVSWGRVKAGTDPR